MSRNLFSKQQLAGLAQLLEGLTKEQTIWLNGYFEGRAEVLGNEVVKSSLAEDLLVYKANLTILFGTETGHSEGLANKLAEKAWNSNVNVKVLSLYDFEAASLHNEDNVAIVVSTHGEGEPPDMAEDFYESLCGGDIPNLNNLNFSVLALGDKTYKHFCKTGEDIYKVLKDLGAYPITGLVKCDVNYEFEAEVWMNNYLLNLTSVQHSDLLQEEELANDNINAETEYSKANPYIANLTEKIRITSDESEKEVYHLELSLKGSGLKYEPGDSLGVFTKNPDVLVAKIIKKTAFDPKQKVDINEEEVSIKDALRYHLEITRLTFDMLRKYYEKTKDPNLAKIINDDKLLDEYLYGHDVLDLLEDFPFEWNANKFVEMLRIIPPRLYSISSSMESVGEEVHITVSKVQYERKNRTRNGACSYHLSNDVEIEEKLPVYIEKNPSFKLPPNGSPVIMVGVGTGIAPYRSFMQHRESLGVMADTWLFFGNRHIDSDFLYDNEWQEFMEAGYLSKMDLAFSRDQEHKVYVQHKLKENRKEVFEWIENGAHFYLCGDMKYMAKDVQRTFLEIISEQGGVSEEQARKYLKNLKREKRFQTDVY